MTDWNLQRAGQRLRWIRDGAGQLLAGFRSHAPRPRLLITGYRSLVTDHSPLATCHSPLVPP